jgi:hypothetical protein
VRRPSVRARGVIDFVSYLRSTIPGCAERVFAQLPPESRSALDGSLPTDWLGVEHSRRWVQAFVDDVGPERAREAFADFMKGWVVRSPLLKPLTEAVIRISGLSPAAAIRVMPRALAVSYRDFFEPRVLEIDEHRAVLLLESLAPEVVACPAYLVCFSGIFEGVIRFTGRRGSVAVTLSSDQTSARCEFTWS